MPKSAPPLPAPSPVRNSELFSNYWLAERLPHEPEWQDLGPQAEQALQELRPLWAQQKSLVEKYQKEAPLEQAFIQPVLRALGWRFYYQPYVQGREPDYALFIDQKSHDLSLSAGHKSPDFWHHPVALADAKAWHVSLDKPTRVSGKREYPPEQIEWYLDRTRLDWALLTNGRLWRLAPRVIPSGKPRFQTYLEVDLPTLLDQHMLGQTHITGEHIADFLYFYFFFGPAGFVTTAGRNSLVERALLGSSEHAVGVSEDLKERVFEALELCIEGFLALPANTLSAESDIEACRTNSFVLLYRLLFVMYAEDRSLLPYRRNSTYTNNRSLARQRDEIAHLLDRRGLTAFQGSSTALWQDLQHLFDLVDRGHARYGVPAYNGGLFSPEHHPFLLQHGLADDYLARIIDRLSRSRDPANPEAGKFRVDYRDLAIRQLGSVYEGLLELRPRFASRRMTVLRSKGSSPKTERYHPAGEPLPKGFTDTGRTIPPRGIYLETDKGERRATGSYYTPDHIVDHIVQATLRPLCAELEAQIEREIQALQQQAQTASGEEKAKLQTGIENLSGQFDDRLL